ncbi:MAG: hypothetical protein ACI89X_004952 [Planctomycetota bacterium]|jgi:hypothetical protein
MQTAAGQRDPSAIANGTATGCNGFINTMTHSDPDGAGLQPQHTVMVGAILNIGDQPSTYAAQLEPITQRLSQRSAPPVCKPVGCSTCR